MLGGTHTNHQMASGLNGLPYNWHGGGGGGGEGDRERRSRFFQRSPVGRSLVASLLLPSLPICLLCQCHQWYTNYGAIMPFLFQYVYIYI